MLREIISEYAPPAITIERAVRSVGDPRREPILFLSEERDRTRKGLSVRSTLQIPPAWNASDHRARKSDPRNRLFRAGFRGALTRELARIIATATTKLSQASDAFRVDAIDPLQYANVAYPGFRSKFERTALGEDQHGTARADATGLFS